MKPALSIRSKTARSAAVLCVLLGAGATRPGARAAPTATTATTAAAAAAFPSPGEAMEALTPNQALPYAPLPPDLEVKGWRLDADGVEPMPSETRVAYMMPPLVRLEYAAIGKAKLQPRQRVDRYRQALGAAGWLISNLDGNAAGLVAHYGKNGRNLWLKLVGTPTALQLTLWEPAAHAQAPVLKDALAQHGRVRLYGILFDINKSVLRPESMVNLKPILTLLREMPTLKLEIQGHSDDSRAHAYARRLSYDRAKTVAQWLITQGVEPARLVAKGFEDAMPVASNQTPEGRARNRRIELVKLP